MKCSASADPSTISLNDMKTEILAPIIPNLVTKYENRSSGVPELRFGTQDRETRGNVVGRDRTRRNRIIRRRDEEPRRRGEDKKEVCHVKTARILLRNL